MESIKVLFFLFFIISIVHSKNQCPTSFCGIKIQYPFKLESQKSQNCEYTNLTCNNNHGLPILNLPFSGDFNVQLIDYDSYTIVISDPDKCLPKRLMNLTISSPFVTKEHQNYTFYNCPLKVTQMNLTAIDCLSNSTNAVVATSLVASRVMEGYYGCSVISTSQVPVSFDFGNQNVLMLTWNVPACKDCSPEKGGWKLKLFALILVIPAIAVGFVILFVFTACCIHMAETVSRQTTNSAADQSHITTLPVTFNTITLPSIVDTGLDDSRINSCSELVVLDLTESLSCPICLENYIHDEVKVRRIKSCDHFFHVECIDPWLGKNITCPVCRISLLDVNL